MSRKPKADAIGPALEAMLARCSTDAQRVVMLREALELEKAEHLATCHPKVAKVERKKAEKEAARVWAVWKDGVIQRVRLGPVGIVHGFAGETIVRLVPFDPDAARVLRLVERFLRGNLFDESSVAALRDLRVAVERRQKRGAK